MSALQFVTRMETVFSGLSLPRLLDVTLHGTLADVLDYLKREQSLDCHGIERTSPVCHVPDMTTSLGGFRTKDSSQELNIRKRSRLSDKDGLEIEEQRIKCRWEFERTAHDRTDSDCGNVIKKHQSSANDLRVFVRSVERGNRTRTHISPPVNCRGEHISEDTLCTSTVRGKHISEDTQEVIPGSETNMAAVIHPAEKHCRESHQQFTDYKASGFCRLAIAGMLRHDTGKCVDASPLVATCR